MSNVKTLLFVLSDYTTLKRRTAFVEALHCHDLDMSLIEPKQEIDYEGHLKRFIDELRRSRVEGHGDKDIFAEMIELLAPDGGGRALLTLV